MTQEERSVVQEILEKFVPEEHLLEYKLKLLDAAQVYSNPTPVVVTDFDLNPLEEYPSLQHYILFNGLRGYTESGLADSSKRHYPEVGEGKMLISKNRLEEGTALPHRSRRVLLDLEPYESGSSICSKYGVIIDNEDIEKIKGFSFWIERLRYNTPYAIIKKDNKSYRLHRFLMGVGDYENHDCVVDHINGNGLDCRKANLRITKQALNTLNRRKSNPRKYGKTSKYMGVSVYNSPVEKGGVRFSMDTRLFRRRFRKDCKTELSAARLYDVIHLYIAGEYATTNFPKESYSPELVERFGRLYLRGCTTFRDYE